MHARELVEVAAMVAAYGPVLIEGSARVSSSAIEQYWSASKSRLDGWLRKLKQCAAASSAVDQDAPPPLAASIGPLLEEVLLAEMLLRVWTGVLYAYDRRRGTNECEPIARSILLGHLEVRQRALALLVHSPLITAEDAILLNRLRRRIERWTDYLLGYLSCHYPVGELAFSPDRTAEYAEDLSHHSQRALREHVWKLSLVSLRVAFCKGLSPLQPSGAANREIAGSILACFPQELFDATGTLQSLWMIRLAHTANDAQGMIEELLHAEAPAVQVASATRAPHTGHSKSKRRRFE